ncbi:CheR family methyltransferase [Loktanella sp. M215]|uniref:CheR family methyltransferase n=1 Tax=Loktanella sp. M215 TaxID=2675431 RepID=UPI001F38D3ED|nr:CheR family methyltransferase [Loktanella sp. M215]MCF7701610.1 PAS domain-containing protein [Loktanella sp. M215]
MTERTRDARHEEISVRVVAIGASAGGIEAFRLFFSTMSDESGMAFVVVLHLASDRKSMLTDIISRWTQMPVCEATDDVVLLANQVYVIPPGVIATLAGGKLHLRQLAVDVPREATPIDTFFDSVAADLGDAAIGVILSGTGHDGSLGMKAIKAQGGFTLAQGSDGTAPQHTGMPSSAIATGAVDIVASVENMAQHIMAMRNTPAPDPKRRPSPSQINDARLQICETLRARVGHDFSQYKDKTFLRRVERRMQVLGIGSIAAYVTRIDADHAEALLLFRDLLIGVTQFFRDEAAFRAVEKTVIPRLFAGKGASDTVRVWVPGCATGEEAYSLAILLREHMDALDAVPKVQLFATDIDEPAIATARAGRYPATLLEGLSTARRDRYFMRQESSYIITKEVRDLCTFSAHSLVRDPPFSRMDLVSCRNLLIYLDVDLQASVIPAFHYSLVPDGVLLLGNSESVARHDDLFAPIDKEHRIFARRAGPSPQRHVPARTIDHSLSDVAQKADGATATRTDGAKSDWSRALNQASARVLERFALPYVVVTADGNLIHYSSHVGGYLQPALGPPSQSVFDLARRGLQLSLRAALRSAVQSGRPINQAATIETDDGAQVALTLIVEPLPGPQDTRPYLIVSKDTGVKRPSTAAISADDDALGLVSQMEREMCDAQEQFQSLNEEHETALEELRSSNEELHSVNEELQSSNEELETSKEEIQSINEEMQTINAQLSTKVDELDRANSDLRNLFESTRVATVFLDQDMIIRGFTPDVAKIYSLIPTDRGRPLTNIVSRLDYPGLRDDVAEVVQTLEPIERRVTRDDGQAHYLVRILPYRAPDSSVDGSVITFVDVTMIVEAEAHQRLLVDELNHRVKNMLAVVVSLATKTLRRAGTLEEFSEVFLGRVHALTAAYTLLSEESWSEVRLSDVIEEELKPFVSTDKPNVILDGPPIPLDPRGALAIGMAIHELATNAVKYGALSVQDGSVLVTWAVETGTDSDELVMEWVERDGPQVTVPTQRGFGTTLIERGLAHDLSGTVDLEFAPSGLRARLRAPLKSGAIKAPSKKDEQ